MKACLAPLNASPLAADMSLKSAGLRSTLLEVAAENERM